MISISSFHIPYGDHQSQFGILRIPELSGRFPVVVTIHGGFWQAKYDLEENEPLAKDLAFRGFATWNIEYRRVGEDGGGWPGTFHDVIAAVNHLDQLEKNFQLDLSLVFVLGHSAGGHLALWLASRLYKEQIGEIDKLLFVPIQGVISLAGVSDLRMMREIHSEKRTNSPVESLIGGTPDEVPQRYSTASPIEMLPLNVDQILIHGELDSHVPVSMSVEYHCKAIEQGDKVRLVVLPEVEHFKIVDPSSSAWKSVIDSLKSLLAD